MPESDSPLLRHSVRKEVQDFMRACEYLLLAAAKAKGSPLSNAEVQMVEAYVIELQTLLQQSPHRRS